jgi:hypothetical protein
VKLVALLLLAIAAPAAADPCDVRIKHASEHVRAEIARWLLDEPRCGPPLEVRIVATETGLYVFARDAAGRIRERTVPDAQSAGVLIASWAAADADSPSVTDGARGTMAVELSYEPARRLSVELTGYTPRSALPPGYADRDAGVARTYAPKQRSSGRTFGLHLYGNENIFGIRGELDVWRRGPVVASAVMSLARDEHWDYAQRGDDELDFIDGTLLGSLGLVKDSGPWRFQVSAGLGLLATYLKGTSYDLEDPNHAAYGHVNVLGLSPTLQGTVALGVRIGDQWYFDAGALAGTFVQNYYVDVMRAGEPPGYTEIEARGLELMFLSGLRYSR